MLRQTDSRPAARSNPAKRLRFEVGSLVCWTPLAGDDLEEDTPAEAEISFTVYDDAQALYSGTWIPVRPANSTAAYEARLMGCDELILPQRDGNMGASLIHVEAYEDMISPDTVIRFSYAEWAV